MYRSSRCITLCCGTIGSGDNVQVALQDSRMRRQNLVPAVSLGMTCFTGQKARCFRAAVLCFCLFCSPGRDLWFALPGLEPFHTGQSSGKDLDKQQHPDSALRQGFCSSPYSRTLPPCQQRWYFLRWHSLLRFAPARKLLTLSAMERAEPC